MRRSLTVLVLVASPLAMAAEPATWAPSVEQQAMIRAFSARDTGPGCAEVEALSADPVTALRELVANIEAPPWVPMRAADCLVSGHAVELQATLELWVTDPALKGLGMLTLSRIDALPVEVARAIAIRAITAGPNPADARRRVARAANPEIAKLSTEIE